MKKNKPIHKLKTPKEELIKWLIDTAIVAISSAASAALGIIGTSVLFEEVNWAHVGSAALLAFIVAILSRIAHLSIKKAVKKRKNK